MRYTRQNSTNQVIIIKYAKRFVYINSGRKPGTSDRTSTSVNRTGEDSLQESTFSQLNAAGQLSFDWKKTISNGWASPRIKKQGPGGFPAQHTHSCRTISKRPFSEHLTTTGNPPATPATLFVRTCASEICRSSTSAAAGRLCIRAMHPCVQKDLHGCRRRECVDQQFPDSLGRMLSFGLEQRFPGCAVEEPA